MLQLTWGVEEPVSSYRHMLRSDLAYVQLLCEGAALDGAYLAPRGLMFLSSAHTSEDIDDVVRGISRSLERMSHSDLI